MTARRHTRGFQWGLRRCSLHAHVHADCWTAVFPGCFTRTRYTPTLHTVKQFTCFGRATRARGFQQTGRDERLCQPQVASTCGCCLATLTDSYDCPRAASNTRHRRGTAQAHCRVFCCVQCRSSPVHRRLTALTTRRRLYRLCRIPSPPSQRGPRMEEAPRSEPTYTRTSPVSYRPPACGRRWLRDRIRRTPTHAHTPSSGCPTPGG